MKKLILILISIALSVGCASSTTEKNYDDEMLKLLKSDFKSKGPVKVERVAQQDDVQRFCSALEDREGSIDELAAIRNSQLETVKYPANGEYIGDWKEGNKVASNGKGGQFSDPVGAENGGNCYGCHQLTKEEVAFGTIGPSLYQYGKLRGSSEDIYKYTWAKIYNAQAFIACSSMPRFGHAGILNEQQIKDVMALLLASDSPVNQ
jgi:L-cysteine S-thiosulfotransferase